MWFFWILVTRMWNLYYLWMVSIYIRIESRLYSKREICFIKFLMQISINLELLLTWFDYTKRNFNYGHKRVSGFKYLIVLFAKQNTETDRNRWGNQTLIFIAFRLAYWLVHSCNFHYFLTKIAENWNSRLFRLVWSKSVTTGLVYYHYSLLSYRFRMILRLMAQRQQHSLPLAWNHHQIRDMMFFN